MNSFGNNGYRSGASNHGIVAREAGPYDLCRLRKRRQEPPELRGGRFDRHDADTKSTRNEANVSGRAGKGGSGNGQRDRLREQER